MLKILALGGLLAAALALAPEGVAADAARPGAEPIKRFVIHGIYTREQRTKLVREGYDIGEAAYGDHVDLYATEAQARLIALRGLRVVPSLQAEPDDFPPGYEDYHNYAEMTADIQAVAAAHPDLVHVFSIGTSYEGRDLVGVRISDDPVDNLSEPGVFYVGQHHAREHLTVEVMLSLIHLYTESTRVTVANLVRRRQIYLIPTLNPDGSEYDIATGSFRYWRKNRQPYQGVYGTDQNRNYTYRWGCCGGSSGNPNSETFRGPNPLSTPEDQRMADFMLAHPNVTTGISYHSYADLILWPYGYTYEDIPSDMTQIDHQTFVAMGAEMERTAGYTAQQSSDLYITDGDWNDWMYGALHRYPITIELSGNGFYPPDSIIPSETRRNHEAALFVARIADCPTAIVGQSCTGTFARARRAAHSARLSE